MLCWLCCVGYVVSVAHLIEKIVENRLKWFGYVERMSIKFILRSIANENESNN